MRVAIFKGAGEPLSIESVKDPECAPGDVIIKVHRCGICGTDLHMTKEHGKGFRPGSVPGHEYSGVIEEVGSEVSGVKKGDLVTALPSRGCGQCDACWRGNVILCSNLTGTMGGFGEYVAQQGNLVTRLPSALSAADGALVEPLAVSLWGVRQSSLKPGARVLVLGGGVVALTTIYWARRLGAGRIVALSRSPHRAGMALAMGADAYVTWGDDEVGEVVEALGGAPELVFECAGAPGLLGRALQHVAPFGEILSLGFCTAPDPFSPSLAARKAATIKFPMGYSMPDFTYSVDMMDSGHVDPKILISSTVAFDDFPAKFEALREPNNETKVHVLIG